MKPLRRAASFPQPQAHFVQPIMGETRGLDSVFLEDDMRFVIWTFHNFGTG